jgi:hypothetical protein
MTDVVNDRKKSNQVGSSAPLANVGQPDPNQEVQPNQQPAPAAFQAAQPASQGSQVKAPNPKPASSGMFTNLQSYINKNQAQASNIGQAASTNFGNQAQKVQTSVADQYKPKESVATANMNQLDNLGNQASNVIGGIVNPTTGRATQGTGRPSRSGTNTQSNVAPVVATSDLDTLSNLYKGNVTGLSDLGKLDTIREQQKAAQLSTLAGNAATEQGSNQLLKDTFGKNREYTRGQSQLDSLILGGDRQALSNLTGGLKSKAEQAQQSIDTTQNQFNQLIAGQEARKTGLISDVKNRVDTGNKALSTQAQQKYDTEMARLKKEQDALIKSVKEGKISPAELEKLLPKNYLETTSQKVQEEKDRYQRLLSPTGGFMNLGRDKDGNLYALNSKELEERYKLAEDLFRQAESQGLYNRSASGLNLGSHVFIPSLARSAADLLYDQMNMDDSQLSKDALLSQIANQAAQGKLNVNAANLSGLKTKDFLSNEEMERANLLAKIAGKDPTYKVGSQTNIPQLGGLDVSNFDPSIQANLSKVNFQKLFGEVRKRDEAGRKFNKGLGFGF